MEMEGAKILWERAVDRHNIRYKQMVSDGDGKAFSALEDTYDEVKVEIMDCVGHVQTRMSKQYFLCSHEQRHVYFVDEISTLQ